MTQMKKRLTDSLDNTVNIVTEDMGISFRIDKCVGFAVKMSKGARCEGIDLGFRI